MIKVDLSMVPFGIGEPYKLGSAMIVNLGNHPRSPKQGNYVAHLYGKDGRLLKKVFVHNFPRTRLLAWDLLCRVLHEAYGRRNKQGEHENKNSK